MEITSLGKKISKEIKGSLVFPICGIVLMSFSFSPAMSFGEEEIHYTFGKAVKAAVDQITLSEADYEGEEEIEREVIYMISAETVFENFKSLDEIAADEEVEVFYKEENGQKKAVTVAKMDTYEWDEEEGLDLEAGETQQQLLENKIP